MPLGKIFKSKIIAKYYFWILWDIVTMSVIVFFIFWIFGIKEGINWLTEIVRNSWYIGVIIFSFIFFGVVLYIRAISYKITVQDDGKIIESQFLSNERNIFVNDITEVQWKTIKNPARPFLSFLSTRRVWMPNLSQGPIFINPTHQNFPRYAVNYAVLTEIERLKSNLSIPPRPQGLLEKTLNWPLPEKWTRILIIAGVSIWVILIIWYVLFLWR